MSKKSIDIFQPGEIVQERFEIIKTLGTSTGGATYLAFLIEGKKSTKVVIKVFPSHRVGDCTAFRRQVDQASQIEHPNVISPLGFISGDETVGYAARYFDGFSFEERIGARCSVSFQESVHTLSQICYGLSAMHIVDVVHGNITARNILLSLDGDVALVDFGFQLKSRCSDSQELLSAEFRAGSVWDKRSDIYSVAALIYLVVALEQVSCSGRAAFIGKLKRGLPHQPLNEVNSDCPVAFSKIIMRALSLNPDDRPQDACELLDELCNEDFAAPDPFSVDSAGKVFKRRIQTLKGLFNGGYLAPTSRASHYKGKKLTAAPKESDSYYGKSTPTESSFLGLLFVIGVIIASIFTFRGFSQRYKEGAAEIDPLQMLGDLGRTKADANDGPNPPEGPLPPLDQEGGYYLYLGDGAYQYIDKEGRAGDIINPNYSPPRAH